MINNLLLFYLRIANRTRNHKFFHNDVFHNDVFQIVIQYLNTYKKVNQIIELANNQ